MQRQVCGCVPIGNSGITIGYSLLYGEKTYCSSTGIGGIEVFDYSSLTAKFCFGGMRRSVQALRFPGNSSKSALILDFRARLANRCKDFPGTSPMATSILDFRARLANRCKDFPGNNPKSTSILDFRPRLGNRCKETCGRRRLSAFTYISCLSCEQQAQIIVSLFLKIP